MRLRILLFVLLIAAVASGAAAMPPALIWRAAPAPQGEAPRHAGIVVELDAATARVVSSRIVDGAPKMRPREVAPGGLFFVLRDEGGAPLLVGQTFDAVFELHGDEPDPATGTLRSLSARRETATFLLRVPLVEGAHDVELVARAASGEPVTADALLAALRADDPSLVHRGTLPLPEAGPAP